MTTETAMKVCALRDEGKFEEAAEYFSDDFEFKSPKFNYGSKTDWIKGFPANHADGPTFEEFVQGDNANQVKRKGKKKIAMVTIHMEETWHFADDG